MEESNETEKEAEAPAPAEKPRPLKAATTEGEKKSSPPQAAAAGDAASVTIVRQPAPRLDDGRRVAASPLARRLASERGVDIRSLEGSGPGGRMLTRDVAPAPPGFWGRLTEVLQRCFGA